jgi:hypothetical protein
MKVEKKYIIHFETWLKNIHFVVNYKFLFFLHQEVTPESFGESTQEEETIEFTSR